MGRKEKAFANIVGVLSQQTQPLSVEEYIAVLKDLDAELDIRLDAAQRDLRNVVGAQTAMADNLLTMDEETGVPPVLLGIDIASEDAAVSCPHGNTTKSCPTCKKEIKVGGSD